MKIYPMGDRVLVKRAEIKKESAGGIILPGMEQKQQMRGTVVGVGPHAKKGDLSLEDKVVFPDFTGTLVGDNYVVLETKDIVAKYED